MSIFRTPALHGTYHTPISNTTTPPAPSSSMSVDPASAILVQLVRHYVGSDAQNEAKRQQARRFCSRLLASRLTPSQHLYSTDLIKKRLVQYGDTAKAVTFGALLNRLEASAMLPKHTSSILYVLHALAFSGKTTTKHQASNNTNTNTNTNTNGNGNGNASNMINIQYTKVLVSGGECDRDTCGC
jgi:hypothetical protein